MKIVIASDHAGYIIKKEVSAELVSKGYAVEDIGTNGLENTDYVDYGIKLGETILENKENIGISICTTGVGFSIICNKVKNIICVKVDSISDAIQAKEHHNANILSFAATKGSNFIIEAVEQFINSKFKSDERYQRRLDKIKEYEEKK